VVEEGRGGGYLGAWGSHHIDQLILWGGPIRRVFCTLRTVAAEYADSVPEFRKITADDTFTLLVQFESGARGIVELFGASQVREGTMEVHGSGDSMTVLDGYRLGRPKPDGSFEDVPIPEDLRIESTPEMALLAPFLVKVEMIRAAIQEGKPASPTFRDAVETQRVLDAARLSDSSGAWETLRS